MLNHAQQLPQDALSELRQQGASLFEQTGLPRAKEEDWKYTNVTGLSNIDFSLPAQSEINGTLQSQLMTMDACLRLVFVDNVLQPSLSDVASLPKGVNLKQGVEAAGALGHVVDMKHHKLAALNQAFLQEVTWIDLDKNVQLEKPIYLVFAASAPRIATMAHPRILIHCNANSHVKVVEHYLGEAGDAQHFCNSISELILKDGARLDHYKLQEQAEETFHISGLHGNLGKDATLIAHNVDLGAKLARNDVVVNLDAPGANVTLNGFYMAGGEQHMDNHTRVNHLKPNTQSLEDYRGVIDDKARCVFNGKVYVAQDAQQIDAQQSNNNLLLSNKAEIDTKPELEIYADDVKCAHGATIGQMDKNALFYLRSRGISEAVARTLLTFAFAESVITRFEVDAVRQRVHDAVIQRLPGHERIEEFL